jgi:hypothetical protein
MRFYKINPIFRNNYKITKEESDTTWKIKRYNHIRQYASVFPPPLNIIEYLIKPLYSFLLKIKSNNTNREKVYDEDPKLYFKQKSN